MQYTPLLRTATELLQSPHCRRKGHWLDRSDAPIPDTLNYFNSRSKTALIKNDILDNKAGEISFLDPIYAYWLKTEYFAE